ncbi:MAG: VWA domain-containing protein, partial [Betaproteobacteria bacterium]
MKRIYGIALAAVLAAPAARSSGRSPQQQPPVFRAGTDVVQVDVVVHDKSGRFVPDLKQEDFEVSEEGKPQKIELFYVVGADETGTPAQAPPVTPSQPAKTPPVVFPHTPRLFVVVFDDDHLSPAGFKRVQAAAISLFEKDFKQGDVGGVVAGGRMVNNRLTTERKELLEAVRSAKPSTHARSRLIDEREWPRMTLTEAVQIRTNADRMVLEAVSLRACQDDPDACRRVDPTESIMEKAARMTVEANTETDATLRTLAVLMNGLGRFQGRKSVLLLTEGFMAEESWPIVGQAVGLAARANATIYTLDARGLDSHDMADQLTRSDPGALDAASRLLNQLDEGSDAMNSLAVDTGGFVVRNENIFDQAVARIADDASHYYVLGYRPDKAPDGKFRKISVKVNRPGVTVRARKGYVAAPRPAATTESARLKPGAPSDTPRAPSDAPTPS